MPLRLDTKRKLSCRSDRVKAVDFHPTEPWLLAALYNGTVYIWNHENQSLVKTFEVTDLPVRAAKFIPRKSWLITGSDDMQIRVYNYNTHEKVTSFEAHQDYIRDIAVHPTQPYILTCSDDMLIKLWDWDKNWRNIMVFDGHTHYIMKLAFNPKDTNTFASACLDRTVKIWSLGSNTPNYTLEGHEKGVNTVDYYHGGDKPYLISGADDKLVKIWDYQNKTCVQTLQGHTQNVSAACYHPELPIIISASEDGTVRLWHASTYRLENTLNYGMERAWTIAYSKGSNDVAFGYDEGTICIKLGREEPAVSMDSSGKIIWAKHSEIQTANVKANVDENLKDGEKIGLTVKDLGNCEIYPQTLEHSPNGRFVVVCGDGEYIIYTALAWRNKSFGKALEFVWALDSNEYAIRESSSKVRLFKNFKEKTEVNVRPTFGAEGIFGGALLGIRGSSFLNFYDWETGSCVRRVDVVPKTVYWSESDLVAIVCESATYVLKYNRVAYQQHLERYGSASIGEEGVEEAFEFVAEIGESVKTGCWVGDCFIYNNSANRLNYLVGGQTTTLSHFDTSLYLLGYIPRDNRVYLSDKDLNVVSFAFPLSLIQYQTAVLRGDLAAADAILPNVPADQRNRVARFLEGQQLLEQALAVSADPEHRFDLAIQLERLEQAYTIAKELDQEDKWKAVGDKALEVWKFDMVEECLRNAKDLEGLLLYYQATGNANGIGELEQLALEQGKHNIAFICQLSRGRVENCIETLIAAERIPEAALFARTYVPSEASRIVDLWRESLEKSEKSKIAGAIASPAENEEMFPDFAYGLFAEEGFKRRRDRGAIPAQEYTEWKDSLDWDVIAQLKERFPTGLPDIQAESNEAPQSNGATPRVRITPTTESLMRNDEEVASYQLIYSLFFSYLIFRTRMQTRSMNSSDERLDAISDNMSHLSLEVNTTGTGSLRVRARIGLLTVGRF
ncbi:coatomer WD associated region-domain-containing protein [Gaertneriomyces semiglobifer]|nr:coatomer WD associated region-domain-containing protein [Gaertneriomyces semiglobifer]